MKKIKYLYLLVACGALLNFTSCSDDNGDDPQPTPPAPQQLTAITFEDVQLPDTGFVNNTVYKSNGITFSNSFSTSAYGDSWEGFAFSKWTDRTTPGFPNQFSVYAASGADGSKQFALAYAGYAEPTNFHADSALVFKPASVYVNNSTYTALNIKNGDNYAEAFEAGDWFKVIFTGYDAQGKTGEKVEFYLADYRDNKTFICNQWTLVDLSVLGSVNKVTITFDSSDKGEFGVNQPQYVCLDNLNIEAR